jgi:hypothetical protein
LGDSEHRSEKRQRAEREQKPGKHDRELVTAPCESWSNDPSRDVLEGPLHDVVVREKASSGRSGPGRGAGRTRFVRALSSSHPPPQRLLMPSLSGFTFVKILPAGRASPVVRGLPVARDVSGVWEDLAVGAMY